MPVTQAATRSSLIWRGRAQFIREKYWEYEYEEVVTPNLFNFELWQRSGHAEHYKDNMFLVDIEGQEFGLKPMNCPGAACHHTGSGSPRCWLRMP
jgi:threonyl-tRNA synthetase